ncbi:MAG TPA: hypothetical protein VMU95_09200 [Trebonia sp.]|nr:hypothetical protein [Trebonia sp.]
MLLTGLISVAGCSSGGASSSAATAGSASPTAARPAATTSGSPGIAPPSWATALGAGATVYPPQPELAGHSEPGQAIEGELTELKAKDLVGMCSYMDPRTASTCKSEAGQVPVSDLPYATNAALGYTVVDGSQALVGSTGTFCTPGSTPECFTNTNPAAIFSAGDKTFSKLWSEATADQSANTYSLAPVVLINGKWYVYGS